MSAKSNRSKQGEGPAEREAKSNEAAPEEQAHDEPGAPDEDDEDDEEPQDDEETEEDEEAADEDEQALAGPGQPREDGPEGETDDPYWWTPHAVLGALLFVGVLGTFGVLSRPLSFLSAKRGSSDGVVATTAATTPPAPVPSRPPTPVMPRPPNPAALPLQAPAPGAK